MPARKKKSVPQRLIRRRPPLTIMREPLTPASLTMRQHNAIWDFLFDTPESQAWLSDMAEQIRSGQRGMQPSKSAKK